jgi:hypothetical protein
MREKGIESAKPIHPASWFRDTRLQIYYRRHVLEWMTGKPEVIPMPESAGRENPQSPNPSHGLDATTKLLAPLRRRGSISLDISNRKLTHHR